MGKRSTVMSYTKKHWQRQREMKTGEEVESKRRQRIVEKE